MPRLTPRLVTGKVRKALPNTISEESSETPTDPAKKPIVGTQFVSWRSKYFAQPVMNSTEENDLESKSYYEREWRYLRNAALRQEAVEEQRKNPKLEHQVFNSRCPDQPKVIMFHPYEAHIALAARDSYG